MSKFAELTNVETVFIRARRPDLLGRLRQIEELRHFASLFILRQSQI